MFSRNQRKKDAEKVRTFFISCDEKVKAMAEVLARAIENDEKIETVLVVSNVDGKLSYEYSDKPVRIGDVSHEVN